MTKEIAAATIEVVAAATRFDSEIGNRTFHNSKGAAT